MKLLAVIFCLVVSVNAWGQDLDTTAKTKPLNSATSKDTLYVIDGEPSQNKLKGIAPKDILSITILNNAAKDPSLNNGINSEVIIVTKQGAIKAYQKKFGAFSKEYKKYFDSQKGEDTFCNYFIDGKSLIRGEKDSIRKLYELPAEKIKSIEVQYPRPIDSFVGVNVRIKTKK